MTAPARMNGARLGLSGASSLRSSSESAARCGHLALDRGGSERVPVRLALVVTLEVEIERGQRHDRPGDADRAGGVEVGKRCADRLGHRRSVLAELLGQPDRADVHAHGAVGEHQLGRAAADVHDHHSVEVVAAERRAGEGEPRLLLAGEQPRREAVAPLDLAEEGLAVLGVADGAGRDAEDALGAELLDPPAVLAEDVADARDREGEEPPARIDALAEARDLARGARVRRARRRRRPRRGAASCSCRDRQPQHAWSYNCCRDAGWSSQVARRAHNPEVAGSNPAPATHKSPAHAGFFLKA